MKVNWRTLTTFGVIGYFVACAPVKFEKIPGPACQGLGETSCDATSEDYDVFTYKHVVANRAVDILVVDDNSGSMSFEQNHMAERFPTLISSLSGIDYRIAITTTDVSSNISDTPNNPLNHPERQDGALLDFGSGTFFLSPQNSDSTNATLFNNTVKRSETLSCEQNGFNPSFCPSPDERGVYAANLVLDRNSEHNFLRPNTHLALVMLSDEDERSNPDAHAQGYSLRDLDMPDTLISRFRSKFPDKTLSAHAIIVKPGDAGCLAMQTGQNGSQSKGAYGDTYAELANKTGGVIGSICENDFSAQLGQIGSSIIEKISAIPVNCEPVHGLNIVTLPPGITASYNAASHQVEFNQPPPPGSSIEFSYSCTKK